MRKKVNCFITALLLLCISIAGKGQLAVSYPTPSDQTVLYNGIPVPIVSPAPTGGGTNPNYQYQWQVAYGSFPPASAYVDMPGATSLTLTFTTGSTHYQDLNFYRIKVTELNSGAVAYSSSPSFVEVYPPVVVTTITPATQTIDYNTAPAPITVSGISGGSSYTYSWQASPDNSNWHAVPGTTATLTYATALTQPTYFRCIVSTTLGTGTGVSPSAFVDLYPAIIPGDIFPTNVTLAAGKSPGTLTSSVATGGHCSGNYNYQWQSSTDLVNWGNVGSGGLICTTGNISVNTYYRMKVSCGNGVAYSDIMPATIGVVDVSFVKTRTVRKPGVTTSSSADLLTNPLDVSQETKYFDGLGRHVQTVTKQGSPLLKDVVSLRTYDAFGREAKQYLPYVADTTDGGFKYQLGQQYTFNAAQFPTDTFFYGQTVYEPSPLDRPLTVYAVGDSWIGAGKGRSMQYKVNQAIDSVHIWNIDTLPGSRPVDGGVYSAGQLFKNVTIDEHGHTVVEYKDKNAHVILKKTQLWNSPAAGHSGWLNTYFVYDNLTNLRFVMQPRAVEWLMVNNWSFAASGGPGIAKEFCFRYEYDIRNRMIIKEVPGGGEVRMVYDILDRLVMEQDSILRGQKKWKVTCYDKFSRVDTIALMTDAPHYNDHAWHVAQALTQPYYPFTAGLPTEVVTQFYFDNYDWVTALGTVMTATMDVTYLSNTTYFYTTYNTYPYAVPVVQYTNVTGMPTGYRTKIIDNTQFLYYTPFYDDHGRIIGTQSTNYSKGFDQEWTQYDFSGKPLRKLLYHKKNPPRPEGHLITTKYTYDAGDRLLSTRKIVDGPERRIDTMMYNELGQLRAKYLENNVDSLVYDYNIRGWMTGINKKYLLGTATNYFGMELGYDNSASGITSYSTPQFNGNVAGTVWKSAGDGVSRKYDFSYDNVDRLTGAAFTQYNGSTFAPSATIDFNVPKITYDANGNILSMLQNGFKLGGSGPIDRLRYSYFTGTNRLQQVYDTANDPASQLSDLHYATATKDPTTDYTYDVDGRLIADKNKGIRQIHYNFLHLPDTISMTKADGSSKGNIVYRYDAMGTKWAKIVTDSTVTPVRTITTLYLKGFEYVNDTLQFVTHEEGRARYLWLHFLNGDSLFRQKFDYFERDHLGNTRVILTDQRDTAQYIATMEGAYRAKENQLFYNIPITAYSRASASGYPVDLATTNPNDSVIRLGNNGQKIGPAIILKVMSGDKVTVGTNYYFVSGGTTGTQQLSAQDVINSLASGIVSLTGGAHGSFSDLTGSSTPLTGALNTFIGAKNTTVSGKPNAYLNYVLLDDQFAYISTPGQSGAMQVATAGTNGGGLQTPLSTTINLKTSGYLYIYVSNASPTWDVFFDNLSVMHYTGPMVEENHYYPYGLTMAGISDKALKGWYPENKYRYNDGSELQNKEFSDGTGLEMYETGLRDLDPQIGRWWQIDSKPTESETLYGSMGNNPILHNDPLGDTSSPWMTRHPINSPSDVGYFPYNGLVSFVNGVQSVLNKAGDYINDPMGQFDRDMGSVADMFSYYHNNSIETIKKDAGAFFSNPDNYFQAAENTLAIMGVGRFIPTEAPSGRINIVEDFTLKTEPQGGRLGNATTRGQIYDIGTELINRGYEIVGGGGRAAEEYLRPKGGGRKGGSYPDITAIHPDYPTLRINTADTYVSGAYTKRELINAARIRSQIAPGEHLLMIPKKKP